MIVTDLDRTLLRSDKTISAYTASVFRQCRERGIKLVFASARRPDGISELTKGIQADGIIATNGAFIYANDELIYAGTFPLAVSRVLLSELSASKEVTEFGVRTSQDRKYTSVAGSGQRTGIFYDFSTPFDKIASHLSFHTEDAAFAQRFMAKYPELVIYPVSGEGFYDVNPAGCTKANGIKRLAEHFGIALSDIAAFGDDYNDIEMLRECGIGVAVANAIDEAKAAANFVCDNNDNDGVAKWINEKILNTR